MAASSVLHWSHSVVFCVHRDAWSALGEMSQEEAMTAYVEEMKLVIIIVLFVIYAPNMLLYNMYSSF